MKVQNFYRQVIFLLLLSTPLSLSLSLSLSLLLFLSLTLHAHTHTHIPLSLFLSLTHIHTFSLSLRLSLTLSLTHTFSPPLSLPLTHTHTFSHSLSLSYSLSLSLASSHSLSHSTIFPTSSFLSLILFLKSWCTLSLFSIPLSHTLFFFSHGQNFAVNLMKMKCIQNFNQLFIQSFEWTWWREKERYFNMLQDIKQSKIFTDSAMSWHDLPIMFSWM